MHLKVSYWLFFIISLPLHGCRNPEGNDIPAKIDFSRNSQEFSLQVGDTKHHPNVLSIGASSSITSTSLVHSALSQKNYKSNALAIQQNLPIRGCNRKFNRQEEEQSAIPTPAHKTNSALANHHFAKVSDINTLRQDSCVALHGNAAATHDYLNTEKLPWPSDIPPDLAVNDGNVHVQTTTIETQVAMVKALPKNFFMHANMALNCTNLDAVVLPPVQSTAILHEFHQLGNPPLQLAIMHGDLPLVKLLLASHENPNSRNEIYGYTALHRAAYYNRLKIAQILLQRGANPHITDKSGYTPLHWAIMNGHFAMVALLLNNHVDPNIVDQDGFAPIHLAARNGYEAIARLLLKKGSNPNSVSQSGHTLLHWAAMKGHLEIVKLLIQRNADLTIVDKYGYTALHWAAKGGNLEIVRLLLSQGCNPNITAQNGSTPLYWAAANGHLDILKVLLDHGANLHIAGIKLIFETSCS